MKEILVHAKDSSTRYQRKLKVRPLKLIKRLILVTILASILLFVLNLLGFLSGLRLPDFDLDFLPELRLPLKSNTPADHGSPSAIISETVPSDGFEDNSTSEASNLANLDVSAVTPSPMPLMLGIAEITASPQPSSSPSPTETPEYSLVAPQIATQVPVINTLPPTPKPVQEYSEVIRIALTEELIAKLDSRPLFDSPYENEMSFLELKNGKLYVTSDTSLVELEVTKGALESLQKLKIQSINLQNYTELHISPLLKTLEDYKITSFTVCWEKNNMGQYDLGIVMNQSLLSILLKGYCRYDIIKLW